MQKTIKLSTPWNHDFLKRTPKGAGVFGNYRFDVDENSAECDYWIVWGNLRKTTKVKCAPQNVIYVTDESHTKRKFDQEFLNQFSTLIACRKDLTHSHIIRSHDNGIWHFNKSYDEVLALDVPKKSKLVSVVSSNLTFLPGHLKRYNYVKCLMDHFGDDLDFFGRGVNPIEDKFFAIADYKYSVAIENSYIPGYFTEKLFECFLTCTLPLYYGCPDLENYFDDRAFIRIDIDDYRSAIQITTDIMRSGIFKERIPFLREAKKLYMEKYLFFPSIVRCIENDFFLKEEKPKTWVTLNPEPFLLSSTDLKGTMVHELKGMRWMKAKLKGFFYDTQSCS